MAALLEPLLRFKNASLGYGERSVLTGVNLEVHAGSFLGILGHNGSGKTTIIKTVLGLIPCLSGEFSRKGVGKGLPRFGYVPQREKLDPIYPLSARDVAAMGTFSGFAPFSWFGGADDRAFIERCLGDCGAHEFSGKPFSDLSGGQKQRILIARALTTRPEILVLDEPLAGIDITTQRALLELLKHLKERRSLTVLMISHRLRAEKSLFTHIAWVDGGKVTAGPTEEMLKGSLAEIFRSEL